MNRVSTARLSFFFTLSANHKDKKHGIASDIIQDYSFCHSFNLSRDDMTIETGEALLGGVAKLPIFVISHF